MYLNVKQIEWVNQIKHLGNYVDSNKNDSIDCTPKKSIFIGQVNKLCANFGCLQTSVLVCLFKNYWCTFYGSQMWQINSQSISSVCTSWNKGVRRILNLPHDAHTWLFDPLLKQNHIKKQFIVRTLRFLFCMLTRCTRGVRVVFSVTGMRSSNSARINKFVFRTEKIV